MMITGMRPVTKGADLVRHYGGLSYRDLGLLGFSAKLNLVRNGQTP